VKIDKSGLFTLLARIVVFAWLIGTAHGQSDRADFLRWMGYADEGALTLVGKVECESRMFALAVEAEIPVNHVFFVGADDAFLFSLLLPLKGNQALLLRGENVIWKEPTSRPKSIGFFAALILDGEKGSSLRLKLEQSSYSWAQSVDLLIRLLDRVEIENTAFLVKSMLENNPRLCRSSVPGPWHSHLVRRLRSHPNVVKDFQERITIEGEGLFPLVLALWAEDAEALNSVLLSQKGEDLRSLHSLIVPILAKWQASSVEKFLGDIARWGNESIGYERDQLSLGLLVAKSDQTRLLRAKTEERCVWAVSCLMALSKKEEAVGLLNEFSGEGAARQAKILISAAFVAIRRDDFTIRQVAEWTQLSKEVGLHAEDHLFLLSILEDRFGLDEAAEK